jgi:hypothetical protein
MNTRGAALRGGTGIGHIAAAWLSYFSTTSGTPSTTLQTAIKLPPISHLIRGRPPLTTPTCAIWVPAKNLAALY